MNYKKMIEQLVLDNKIEYTKNTINLSDMEEYEKAIGVKFGNELIDYITNYGYLAYKHIEFYGINSKQKLDSDLIKQTIYLHENYEITKSYIAFENIGDNIYTLIDENDNVYEIDLVSNDINNIGLKLYEYVFKKYNETADRINNVIDSISEQIKDTSVPKILTCPICNANLMYLEPDGTTLYCRNCNKNFKNNNGSVGEETTSPYTDSTALY